MSSGYIQFKIFKAFCQTPRNDFDFDGDIWFENRSLHALDINIVAKKMKEISKATSLSQLYKSWSPKLSYLFIPMSTVLSHATKDCQRISSVVECSDIISRSLNFGAPSSHSRKVILTVHRILLLTRGGQMSIFNFKVCSLAVILVLLMLF